MRIRRRWTAVIGATVAVASVLGTAGGAWAAAGPGYPTASVGIDISYPSCHTKIPAGTAFGVIGVSGGRVYEDNACAKAESSSFATPSFYVNTGLYTGGTYFSQARTGCAPADDSCAAYNYGFSAGQHAIAYAQGQGLGLTPTTWWLDVENSNTWDASTALNVQSIQGEYDALTQGLPAGSVVGVYAVPSQWRQIVGSSFPAANTWPVWYATGAKNLGATSASRYCSPSYSFTGGAVQLVQWVAKIDQDYAC